MKANRILSVLLAFACIAGMAVPAWAAEEEPVSREEQAQQIAEAAAQYGGATSAQYAVWQDGEIILSGEYGSNSMTEEEPVTAEHLYGIGSVSKVYTTAAVMKLVEEGKIDLDKPVTTYLPDFRMADERYRAITVRMLLNHSSGLMGSTFANTFFFDDADRIGLDNLLNQLSTQRLKADPGAYSVYCNDGFTLAELVVETVSGKTFLEYLHEELFAPLGLEHSFAPGDNFAEQAVAHIYQAGDPRPVPMESLVTIGTGGIYSSASDLATFGGMVYTGDALLTQASREATMAHEYAKGLWPEDTEDMLSYGLGWDSVNFYPFAYSDIQALAKGGDTQYYHAGLVVLPEYHMAAAVVSSGGVSTFNEMAAAQLLVAVLEEQGVVVEQTPQPLPEAVPADMPAELLEKAGYYSATGQQFDLSMSEDGVLSLQSISAPSTPAQVFYYHDDGSFRDETGTAMLRLVEEKNGETYLWQKSSAVLPVLGTLPISNYAAQRVEPITLTEEVETAWAEINAKGYLMVSEKYTSQVWMTAMQQVAELPEMIPGYLSATEIVDEAHTAYRLQIPGSGGRDGQETVVEQRGDVTYLDIQGYLFADSSIAQEIWLGDGAYCTIGDEGYARWYQVADAYAGKTMTVTLPEHGGFTVYAADGTVVAASVGYGDISAELPEGGWIVFVGDPAARFQLSLA